MNFDEYRNYDAMGLAALIRQGEVGAGQILEVAADRADAMGERLNILTVDDTDFAIRLIDGGRKGPLAGVPFLFKDLYCFLQDTIFTNGSRIVGDFRAPATSTFVQRCLDCGLVPFGKTNSPEFGVNVVTEPLRHGPCRNPWNGEFSPGGSSGGAAAAVAAGIVPMAHASDGGGSIRIPASVCGLLGLKPSRARTPVGPVVGEAWSGLASGFVISRSVRDSALMLDILGGEEAGNPYACLQPEAPFLDLMDREPGQLRIGFWLSTPLGSRPHQDCIAAVEDTARLLEELGHIVEPTTLSLEGEALLAANLIVIGVNMANDLDFWANASGQVADEASVETMTLALAEGGRRHSGQEFAQALAKCHGLARSMGGLFETFDLLLTPTLGTPPLPIGTLDQNGCDLEGYLSRTAEHIPYTPLYNMSGCPAINLPLFWNADELPIGTMLGAPLGREDRLLQIARQVERARPWFNRRSQL